MTLSNRALYREKLAGGTSLSRMDQGVTLSSCAAVVDGVVDYLVHCGMHDVHRLAGMLAEGVGLEARGVLRRMHTCMEPSFHGNCATAASVCGDFGGLAGQGSFHGNVVEIATSKSHAASTSSLPLPEVSKGAVGLPHGAVISHIKPVVMAVVVDHLVHLIDLRRPKFTNGVIMTWHELHPLGVF